MHKDQPTQSYLGGLFTLHQLLNGKLEKLNHHFTLSAQYAADIFPLAMFSA